eukprot:ANDGO_00701.mRNA.1 hypothetical protein
MENRKSGVFASSSDQFPDSSAMFDGGFVPDENRSSMSLTSSATVTARSLLDRIHTPEWWKREIFGFVHAFHQLNIQTYLFRSARVLGSFVWYVLSIIEFLQLFALCMSAPELASDSFASGSQHKWAVFLEQLLYFGSANNPSYSTVVIRLY